MKKIIVLVLIVVLPSFVLTSRSDIIEKLEASAEMKKAKTLNDELRLKKFKTQESFELFLADKLYNKVIASCNRNYYYVRPEFESMSNMSVWWAVWWAIASSNKKMDLVQVKEKSSYWDTNIQKKWVDEPEILKLWSEYIAYYNSKEWKIFIIKSPNITWKLDLNKVSITHELKIPSLIDKNDVKLFYVDNQLIVIWWRYSKSFWWSVTDLVFYKITNGKAIFDRIYDVKWRYSDARIVDWKIYLITNYNFSNMASRICEKYVHTPLEIKFEELKKKHDTMYRSSEWSYNEQQERISKNRELIRKASEKLLKEKIWSLKKQEVLKEIKKMLLQRSVDIKINKDAKFKLKGKEYPLEIDIVNSGLENIVFLPTSFDKISIHNLNFSLTNIVDLDKNKRSSQYVMFWNMWNWQIHMTKKSLYLVSNYSVWHSRTCPIWNFCAMPYYDSWPFSLIHKLSINWTSLDYIDSWVIPWMPINQYSMDEDSSWNFRIFTKFHHPKRKTSLFTFDDKMKIAWSIMTIAPWEDLKSSRFIEDKAYLVTFKTTDPLFAIDMKDNANPKILWELKIPWYSLYMHPFSREWSAQYLVWIWQEAEEVNSNRALPKNIKIDLYKIDFNKKNKDWTISVTQEFSKVIGKETKVWNWWSFTPSFTDPRTFVMLDNADSSKTLLLPVYLAEDAKEKKCYTTYTRREGSKRIWPERCDEYTVKIPYFVWIKWFRIDSKDWISENLSKNYIDKLTETDDKSWKPNRNSRWKYISENHRVSYYTVAGSFVPFEINTRFFDMFTENKSKFIDFSWK